MNFCVYSKSMAYYLRLKGFKIEYTAPNRKNLIHDVFYFKNTPELQDAIQTYLSKRKIEKNEDGRKKNSNE